MTDGKPNFPNARYAIGETEYQFWSAPERMSGPTEGAAKAVAANVTPLRDKMTFLNDQGEVVSGIRAMAAPGHTPGHMAFHIESEGKRLLLGADFCNHYVLSLQRPDWEVRFDADKAKAAETRKKMLDMIAADRIPFTSYHMPFPSVGYVRRRAKATATCLRRIRCCCNLSPHLPAARVPSSPAEKAGEDKIVLSRCLTGEEGAPARSVG